VQEDVASQDSAESQPVNEPLERIVDNLQLLDQTAGNKRSYASMAKNPNSGELQSSSTRQVIESDNEENTVNLFYLDKNYIYSEICSNSNFGVDFNEKVFRHLFPDIFTDPSKVAEECRKRDIYPVGHFVPTGDSKNRNGLNNKTKISTKVMTLFESLDKHLDETYITLSYNQNNDTITVKPLLPFKDNCGISLATFNHPNVSSFTIRYHPEAAIRNRRLGWLSAVNNQFNCLNKNVDDCTPGFARSFSLGVANTIIWKHNNLNKIRVHRIEEEARELRMVRNYDLKTRKTHFEIYANGNKVFDNIVDDFPVLYPTVGWFHPEDMPAVLPFEILDVQFGTQMG